MSKKLTVEMIEEVAYWIAKKTMDWDEPIPEFSTRYPHILEGCIIAPFQKFNKKFLYKGLIGKGAILFYLLIKNHPFQNGNKRIAVTTLLVFLHLNGKWLKVDRTELYNFAVWVAESSPKFKDQVISAIEKFIKIYLVDLSSN